ncbi:MAG: peptide ABC transporter ATP-binding protein [Chloroflexi bacterium 13_1_40CM_3_65_12]|nr:MAG: peptide ABC transporter ATP-binding protein [Chloroflexi bacterium 13_1_40CM_4_65_13]OLD24637.1 MAG: peptide ABC transporter ATP-binding protein [Chloroflexi bacterium 13_1_40CM_3_65_12]OLD46787.1 MAG: peptide ABC transporter ATP-binding protein [Chloroflexi bacterium 13_1_40CM_2_68_14]
MAQTLLQVEDLHTQFFTRRGVVRAVDGVSLHIDAGETLGVVGESGCGKTMTALSVLRLVPDPGRITSGRILFRGRDVTKMTDDEIRDFRGNDVAMIFQDPMTSLNPVTKIGSQIEEAMTAHKRFSPQEAGVRVIQLLKRVRVPAAERRVSDYPHQFSGGMRQRAMIAMGLANEPSLLIADEPTTALDVTVQAQIIDLLKQLNRELGTAMMLITHNMALVASLCERVVVMYAGRVVEEGPVERIFKSPQHPYTWSLLRSVPRVDELRKDRLVSIKGLPPDLSNAPPGCKFHPRCPFVIDRCKREEPELAEVAPNQVARCWVLMRNVPEEAAEVTKQVVISEEAAKKLQEIPGAGS